MVECDAVNVDATGSNPVSTANDKPLFYNGRWRHIDSKGWVELDTIACPLWMLDDTWDSPS